MTRYDYIVIGFYLIFMLGLGPVYKGFSKTASDYFRCGGAPDHLLLRHYYYRHWIASKGPEQKGPSKECLRLNAEKNRI